MKIGAMSIPKFLTTQHVQCIAALQRKRRGGGVSVVDIVVRALHLRKKDNMRLRFRSELRVW